jgi:hypothetical protein
VRPWDFIGRGERLGVQAREIEAARHRRQGWTRVRLGLGAMRGMTSGARPSVAASGGARAGPRWAGK